jgi:hypothetical protein
MRGHGCSRIAIRSDGTEGGEVHTDRTFECGPSPFVTGALLLMLPLVRDVFFCSA